MGFDVVYLPPVHPIGRTHRKGRNNALTASPGDPGSPWAIGSERGRPHRDRAGARHARRLRSLRRRRPSPRARGRARHRVPGVAGSSLGPRASRVVQAPARRIDQVRGEPAEEVPGHLPVRFREPATRRRCGRRCATCSCSGSRTASRSSASTTRTRSRSASGSGCIADDQARASRRDLPGRSVHAAEGDALPGEGRLHQSYTYFTWRNTAAELREYLTELTRTEPARSSCGRTSSPTRPTSCTSTCRHGGRPAFEVRLILAATLSASYGIYSGFELCENVPVRPGSEEYLDSEKYEIKPRDWNQPGNLKELIARVNAIRRDHPALQQNDTLAFHDDRQPGAALVQQDRRPTRQRTSRVRRRQHRPALDAARLGPGADRRARHRPRRQSYVVEDLLDERTLHVARRVELRASSIRPNAMAHIFVDPDASDELRPIDSPTRSGTRTPIIYEAHVRAFYDSNGDGIGDFAGLTQKLPYLHDLGVTCLWLLPFYPSPLRDDGYDIADYTSINPIYGTLDDFKRFLDAAHALQHPRADRAGHQPHLRPASVVPAGAARAEGLARARLLRLERHRRRSTRARASSSPTPRSRTGRSIRWPASTTGIASSRTSRI